MRYYKGETLFSFNVTVVSRCQTQVFQENRKSIVPCCQIRRQSPMDLFSLFTLYSDRILILTVMMRFL